MNCLTCKKCQDEGLNPHMSCCNLKSVSISEKYSSKRLAVQWWPFNKCTCANLELCLFIEMICNDRQSQQCSTMSRTAHSFACCACDVVQILDGLYQAVTSRKREPYANFSVDGAVSRPTISSCLKIICGHDHLIRVQNCHFFLHSLFIFYDILMFMRKLHGNQFDRNISGFVSEHCSGASGLLTYYFTHENMFVFVFR